MPEPTERAMELAMKLAGEVLAKIASYDPYFPKPNPPMLMAWAEHLVMQNCPARDDLLKAVSLFYADNATGVKPLPGSISGLAWRIKQDRLSRADYRPPPDKSADPELPAVNSRRITLAEWEATHGEKFPKAGKMFRGVE